MIEKEIEVKVIGYSLDQLKNIISKSGAEFIKKENQKNYRFINTNLGDNSYLRLRVTDEYSEFTLKTKEYSSSAKINQEITTEVSDPKSFLKIMETLGYKYDLEEKERNKYILGDYIFDLDIWNEDIYPYPYLEIEAPSVEKLEELLMKLNIPKDKITTKSIGELISEL